MQVQSLSDVLKCGYIIVWLMSLFTKQVTWVQIPVATYALVAKPGNAAACKAAIREFKSLQVLYTPLAQLVEQGTLNAWVEGSSPSWCITHPRCSVMVAHKFVALVVRNRSPALGYIVRQYNGSTGDSESLNVGPIPARTTIAGVSAYTRSSYLCANGVGTHTCN